MPPAEKRFDTLDASCLHVHFGLIEELEFATIQRAAHTGHQRQTLERLGIQLFVVELIEIAAELFRAKHRRARVANQRFRFGRVVLGHRDADARGQLDRAAADVEWAAHRFEHSLRNDCGLCSAARVADEEHEFVAGEARQRILFAQRRVQAIGDGAKQTVS